MREKSATTSPDSGPSPGTSAIPGRFEGQPLPRAFGAPGADEVVEGDDPGPVGPVAPRYGRVGLSFVVVVARGARLEELEVGARGLEDGLDPGLLFRHDHVDRAGTAPVDLVDDLADVAALDIEHVGEVRADAHLVERDD